MHVIKFPMESVNLVTPESSRELSKDALPADDNGDFEKEEICASQWIGDPVSLTNSILGISSSEDIKLIPYCNLLGFFLVRAVEVSLPSPYVLNMQRRAHNLRRTMKRIWGKT